jgi:gluconolactonase
MKSKALLTVAACVVAWVLAVGHGSAAPGQAPAGRGQAAAQAPIVCQGAPGTQQARGAAPQAAGLGQVQAQGEGQAQGQGRGAAQPTPSREVTVTAIPGVVAAGAKFTQVFQTVGNNVDGTVAAPDGSLLASQEDNNAVLKIDKDDRASVFIAGASGVGSLSIDRQGRLFGVRRIAQPGTPAATQPSAPTTAGISMLLPELKRWDTFENGTKMTGRPSDLSADSTGGAYFTQGCVYYASPNGTITLVGENVRANGIVLSEDEKRLYVTNGENIVAFDVQGPGRLTNQREFTKLDAGGNGDGLAVDTAGRLYVAAGPGVQIFSKEGRYIGLIPTPPPSRPTGQAFAGPDRKTLYVVVQATTDAHGRPMAGRTVYRIPMLAQGPMGRSK